ncbi:MAG: hypothetical protein MK538_03365 [Planctomycetes bacterium]|nr:hypothetical protein [Planctomycetota bacterium]
MISLIDINELVAVQEDSAESYERSICICVFGYTRGSVGVRHVFDGGGLQEPLKSIGFDLCRNSIEC